MEALVKKITLYINKFIRNKFKTRLGLPFPPLAPAQLLV